MSGGEAIREEKRLGRRSDSDALRCSSTDLSKSPRILSPFESLCHSPASLRIALSLSWFAAADEPTRVEAVSSRKQ